MLTLNDLYIDFKKALIIYHRKMHQLKFLKGFLRLYIVCEIYEPKRFRKVARYLDQQSLVISSFSDIEFQSIIQLWSLRLYSGTLQLHLPDGARSPPDLQRAQMISFCC